ncbi:hypothetical protein CC86DRAFT_404118 [Ophiobolus disseminans]|uniref:Uncharacterized protein n=1 Tax=Ophiobolus disseminans TaxID=1469910 RepID=A0A6A7A857_9PLEO|nr:hypothetical protein CC86DRAFT_404118 [Ophiobolus disseminans]
MSEYQLVDPIAQFGWELKKRALRLRENWVLLEVWHIQGGSNQSETGTEIPKSEHSIRACEEMRDDSCAEFKDESSANSGAVLYCGFPENFAIVYISSHLLRTGFCAYTGADVMKKTPSSKSHMSRKAVTVIPSLRKSSTSSSLSAVSSMPRPLACN